MLDFVFSRIADGNFVMSQWFQKRNSTTAVNNASVFSLSVRAKPNSSRSQILGVSACGTHLDIALNAPPVDGAANEELVAVIAKALKILAMSSEW